MLLFGDEAEALTHPDLAHAWAKRGEDLRVEAPGRAHKPAMLGVLDFAARRLIVNTSTTKRSGDFIVLLGRLDAAYGPCPAHGSSPWAEGPRPQRPVILVLDNGPIHTSKASRAAPSTSSGGRAPVAQDRRAAEICSGAERHRAILARPEVSLSCAPDLLRSRSSRSRHSRGDCRYEPRVPNPRVYQPTKHCLTAAVAVWNCRRLPQ